MDGTNFVKSRRRSRASSEGSHSDVSLSETSSGPVQANSGGPVQSNSASAQSSQPSVGKETPVVSEVVVATAPVTAQEVTKLNLVKARVDEADAVDEFKDAIDSRIPTFFSVMSTRWIHF